LSERQRFCFTLTSTRARACRASSACRTSRVFCRSCSVFPSCVVKCSETSGSDSGADSCDLISLALGLTPVRLPEHPWSVVSGIRISERRAAEYGAGFELPNELSVVPMYRKSAGRGLTQRLVKSLNRREKRLVGERGFEPPTPWSRTRCSTRLSHSPTMGGVGEIRHIRTRMRKAQSQSHRLPRLKL
jgi:hypothetical protein